MFSNDLYYIVLLSNIAVKNYAIRLQRVCLSCQRTIGHTSSIVNGDPMVLMTVKLSLCDHGDCNSLEEEEISKDIYSASSLSFTLAPYGEWIFENLHKDPGNLDLGWLGFMVFHATFNNILVISWRSVLFMEETGRPGVTLRPTASY